MTAFFPPLWSRGPARYLMEKYWIWCVAETVHNPVKSFRQDFSKGVLSVYPVTLSATHFFMCRRPSGTCYLKWDKSSPSLASAD